MSLIRFRNFYLNMTHQNERFEHRNIYVGLKRLKPTNINVSKINGSLTSLFFVNYISTLLLVIVIITNEFIDVNYIIN